MMDKQDKSPLKQKIHAAEKSITKDLLKWKLKKQGQDLPDDEILDAGSERIVEEANRRVANTGKGLFRGLKEAKKAFLEAYRDDDDENKQAKK
ncbi:MAG: hypothetical protein GY868_13465 [Deltaproteobacteria bacterium]|nr:hypothetical protein [Deltaproteobacteria bacterium]